jgi:hypothetical protein
MMVMLESGILSNMLSTLRDHIEHHMKLLTADFEVEQKGQADATFMQQISARHDILSALSS